MSNQNSPLFLGLAATHGIVKKTQKTPLKEITKAEEIRKEYFNNKNK
jgi:phage-related protein